MAVKWSWDWGSWGFELGNYPLMPACSCTRNCTSDKHIPAGMMRCCSVRYPLDTRGSGTTKPAIQNLRHTDAVLAGQTAPPWPNSWLGSRIRQGRSHCESSWSSLLVGDDGPLTRPYGSSSPSRHPCRGECVGNRGSADKARAPWATTIRLARETEPAAGLRNFASSDPHPSPPTPPTARCVSRPVTAPLCRSCRRGWASCCRA